MKLNIKNLQKVSKTYQCVVQNLKWLVLYPRSTFSNDLFHNVLTLVPLTTIGPEVVDASMITFISDSYDTLEENIYPMKSIKLKSYPGGNVKDLCTVILVDAEHLESDRAFKPDHLRYTTNIFENTSD